MAVNATVSRATLVAAAAQTDFNFNFTIKNDSDLEVYQRAPTTTPSDSDKLILTQDYTVTIDSENGGIVSLNIGATLNDIIIIQTNIPFERAADFTDQKQYTADNVNADLDNTIIGQKQNDMRQTELTPHYADSSLPAEERDLSLPILGVNQYHVMNSSGTAITARYADQDDPGAAQLRADLISTGGASIVGTNSGFGTTQDALDEVYPRGPLYAVDQGLGNPNELNITTSPATTSYKEGEFLIVKVSETNTGGVTINKDGLGFINITDSVGGVMLPGFIQAGQVVPLVFSGGNYIYSNRDVVASFGGINPVIDGGFNIWPEGDTFNINTASGEVYTANNFICSSGSGASATTITRGDFTPGQTDVPGNPKHFLRFDQALASGLQAPKIGMRIADAETLSGETLRFSCYLKADAPLQAQFNITQNFGTGGITSPEETTSVPLFNITTSWERYTAVITVPTVLGKTFGTNNDSWWETSLTIPFSEGVFAYETTNWWFGDGVFPNESLADIRIDCNRFYEKSYSNDVSPGTVTDVNASTHLPAGISNNRYYTEYSIKARVDVDFKVYSPLTGAEGFIATLGGADLSATYFNVGDRSSSTELVSTSGSTTQKYYHWTVDARPY